METAIKKILIGLRWIAAYFTLFGLGISLCFAQSGGDRVESTKASVQTVFLIVMENHNWTGNGSASIKGNASAPYINEKLLPLASHAENYNNPKGNHPSLPNYLWLEAGTNFGIHEDGSTSEYSQATKSHLVTLPSNAGISWKSYDEDITGTDCPILNEGSDDKNGDQLYAARHDPFVYFEDVTGFRNLKDASCIAHIRPFTELKDDPELRQCGALQLYNTGSM